VARDAFNGTLLWKKRLSRSLGKKALVAAGDRLYAALGEDNALTILDGAAGRTVQTCEDTNGTREIVCTQGVVVLYVGGRSGSIVAVDGDSGQAMWKTAAAGLTAGLLAATDERVCYHGNNKVVCLQLQDGGESWQATCDAGKTSWPMMIYRGVVLVPASGGLRAYALDSGKPLWNDPRVDGRLGAIGPVREVHCWTNRPQWPQGIDRPKDTPAVPSHLDWDLWLGPAPMRPYHPAYLPVDWRGWRDLRTGALGAMECHVMDGVYWALRLGEADRFTVEADSTGVTAETYPRAATVRYRFPQRGSMPPVVLNWYDSGRRPPRPKELPDTREFLGSNGTIFVGEKGKLVFGAITAGTNPGQAGPRLMPESLMQGYRPPQETIPRVTGTGQWVKASRHVQEWIQACKGGKPACSRFEIAGPLTELALLGNVALLSGKTLHWNVEYEPEANQYVRRPYRKGWSL